MSDSTLHAEITAILVELGNRWTGVDELAARVNQRGRYKKKDSSAMKPGQIHLRTRTGGAYESLFERKGRLVRLRGTVATSDPELAHLVSKLETSQILLTQEASDSLTGPGQTFDVAVANTKARPGLYAIFGDSLAWAEIGLGSPPDARPLYVAKAERSLLGRDIGQHFSDGKTGSSTVRRSLAALLHDQLRLRGVPRNRSKPADFDRYGLSPADDTKLTEWMRGHLSIATWAPIESVVLADYEQEIVRKLEPPLNLTIVRTRWFADISAKRARMAEEARNWEGKRAQSGGEW